MNLPALALTPRQFRQAAEIKERIDSLQAQLLRLLGQTDGVRPGSEARKPVSATARARIAAAARARWARARANSPSGAVRGRKMSAAAKARLAAIARERWRRAKAQGKNAL